MFLLKILLNFLSLGKFLSINERNVFATFVAILMLKGGLNQVIFRFLVLFFSLLLFVHFLSKLIVGLYCVHSFLGHMCMRGMLHRISEHF